MHNVLYLTYQENPFKGNIAIIKTQVEELLKRSSKYNNVTWLLILNEKLGIDQTDIEKYRAELRKFNIETIILKHNVRNIYTGFLKLKRNLKAFLDCNNFDVIHCRGYAAALLSNLSKGRESVVFDMRGAYPEEEFMNKGFPFRYFAYVFWKFVEAFNIKKSERIIVVTDYFKKYIAGRYKCEKKVRTVYNCVNTEDIHYSSEWRNIIREEMGCQYKKIVVYCGSIYDKWQSFDKTVELYKLIKDAFKSVSFLILTKDIYVDLQKYGLGTEEVFLRKVDNKEVYKYLSAGDYALLYRKESIVNAVAFPVKFAEYIACGLPVIISPAMKGIAEIINDKGIVFNGLQGQIEKIDRINKENCIEFGDSCLSTDIIAKRYKDIYQELIDYSKEGEDN